MLRSTGGVGRATVLETQALYHLQELDLEIEDLKRQCQALEARLAEPAALQAARAEAQAAQQALRQAREKLRDLEWAVERLTAKIQPLEQRLYSGVVRNPKELDAMQKELEWLQAQRRRTEDQVLEQMAVVEQQQAETAQREQRLAAQVAAWENERSALLATRESLRERLAALQQARAAAVAALTPGLLERYEELRRAKRGRAVALVERNVCQGCRMALAPAEVQRARQQLTVCSSCGRILYVPR